MGDPRDKSKPVTYKDGAGAVYFAPLGTPFPQSKAEDGTPISMGPDGVTRWVRL